MKHKNTCCC